MVTRVRVEAEGSTLQEVEDTLTAAHEQLVSASGPVARKLFGAPDAQNAYPALVDAEAGEFVIERFASAEEVNFGAIVYRGRMTSHYARPRKVVKLNKRSTTGPQPHHVDDVDPNKFPVLARFRQQAGP